MATCDVNILKTALGIQQTGPRTVIVPADPIIWDDGTSYEYLTIVASTDFGQAYISKRDVPAGTPLTNTEYWIPAATFNAQLAEIMRQLTNKADTATVTALQTSLNNEVARAKAAEQANATAASSANTNANGRAPKVHTDASGATYGQATGSVFGHVKLSDSAGESDATDGVAATPKAVQEAAEESSIMVVIGDSWSNTDPSLVKWPQIVADYYGYTLKNYAVGGAGFINGTKTFLQQIQEAVEEITDQGKVARLYVEGFVNDLGYGSSAILAAIDTFDAYCETNWPTVPRTYVNMSIFPTTTTAQLNTLSSMMVKFETKKASIIDLVGGCSPNNCQSDGRHPDGGGHMMLAGVLVNPSGYMFNSSPSQMQSNGYPTLASDHGTITAVGSYFVRPTLARLNFSLTVNDTIQPNNHIQIVDPDTIAPTFKWSAVRNGGMFYPAFITGSSANKLAGVATCSVNGILFYPIVEISASTQINFSIILPR